jgi:para-aminobenzoate synthetase component 1
LATPRITELEHWDAVAPRFRGLADLPWPAWLDSASPARYDVLVADPYVTLRTRGAVTEIAPRDGETVESTRAPLELVREALGSTCAPAPGLPFFGGAVGYVSYDLGRRFERIPSLAAADIAMPELAIGIYDWAVIVDHADRKTWLAGLGRDSRTFARWSQLVRAAAQANEGGAALSGAVARPRA